MEGICLSIVRRQAGIIYGVANDAITSSISWEYFFYGKGLDLVMPAQTAPDATALRHAAMEVGCKAGGSAGILIGAALLIANNPRVGKRRFSTPSFLRFSRQSIRSRFSARRSSALPAPGWLLWTSHDPLNSGDQEPTGPRTSSVPMEFTWAHICGVIGTAIAVLALSDAGMFGFPGVARQQDEPGRPRPDESFGLRTARLFLQTTGWVVKGAGVCVQRRFQSRRGRFGLALGHGEDANAIASASAWPRKPKDRRP